MADQVLQEEGGKDSETENGQAENETGQADTPAVVVKETNSLRQWEQDLPEGKPEEMRASAIRGLDVTLGGESLFAVSYEPRAYKNSFDCWSISVPYESMVSADTEIMYDYFESLAELKLERAEGVSREEAGIGEDDRRIFLAYFEGQTDAGGQAEPDRKLIYDFGKKDGTGSYYVEVAGEILLAEETAVERIFSLNPFDFILKVVSVISVETVSKVEIETEGKEYVMETGDGSFTFDGRKVDSQEFYGLYTELMSVFIEKEIPITDNAKDDNSKDNYFEKDNPGEDNPERNKLLTVIYHRNMEEAPQIIQEYYAWDENYALARVNGTEFFLVSRQGIETLRDKIEDAF